MKRRIFSVFTLIALLCALCMTAYAHDVPDLSRKGSISITMHHSGELVPGGTLTLFRVGEVYEDDGNFGYRLTGDFVQCGVSLDDIQSAALPEALANYVQSNKLVGRTEKIDENAVAYFDDLELGLYLIIQYKAAEGFNVTKPFVVSVPAVVNGQYLYDVDGSPKVDPITDKPTQPTTPPTTQPSVTKPSDTSLPQTGQLNWPVPVLAVSGLVLFTVGWFLRFGRKREDYEK